MLKHKILIKFLCLICLLIFCVYGDTIETEVVVLWFIFVNYIILTF
jgi:hypothetical protein